MLLSDSIESFIKEMLGPEDPEVELKRSELASYFRCAPSQINYVLATRFTEDDGYLIESRRGGGGYIRIVRLSQSGQDRLRYLIQERIGDSLEEAEAQRIIGQLETDGTVDAAEGGLLRAAVAGQALAVPIPGGVKDALRARILKSMLISLARQGRS